MSKYLAKSHSVALVGTDARLVEVEVHAPGNGLPAFRIVGLPAKSVTEAEQRTRAASTGRPAASSRTSRPERCARKGPISTSRSP
jgi:hypothetical protein